MKPEEVTLMKAFFEEQNKTVALTIQVTVNGKIDSMKKDLIDMKNDLVSMKGGFEGYVEVDTAWKEKHKEWQDSVEPMKIAYINTNWLWDLFIKILKFLGMLGAATAAIYFLKGKLD